MKTESSSNKILLIIIGVLLIANIGTLSMLFFSGVKKTDPFEERRTALRNYVKDDVGFSEEQMKAFDTIKAAHRAEVKVMLDAMRERKKNNLLKLASVNFTDSLIEAAASDAGAAQKNLELNMLRHLRDLRKTCRPDQLPKFDSGFYSIMTRPLVDPKKKEK